MPGGDRSLRHSRSHRLPPIPHEGRDVGFGVEGFWGEGNDYCARDWSVDARAVPAMIAALGGAPDDDPLALLKAWYDAGDGRDPGIHLYEAGVPMEKWSSLG